MTRRRRAALFRAGNFAVPYAASAGFEGATLAKLAATSQTHDEARHFYVMADYLKTLGVIPRELGPRTTRILNGTLQAPTLAQRLIGMQLMIEPMAGRPPIDCRSLMLKPVWH